MLADMMNRGGHTHFFDNARRRREIQLSMVDEKKNSTGKVDDVEE